MHNSQKAIIFGAMNVRNLHEIHIFLASSKELEQDRKEITDLINQLNRVTYWPIGIHIQLDKWECHDPAYKGERTQAEYDVLVRNSQLFIALFHQVAGKYTLEEFSVAHKACIRNKFPHICIYYKHISEKDIESTELINFKKWVDEELEYFTIPPYTHIDTLRYSIMMQLAHLSNNNELKAEIKGSDLMLGNLRIGNLNHISFSGNNTEVIRLKQEIEDINNKLKEIEEYIYYIQSRIELSYKEIKQSNNEQKISYLRRGIEYDQEELNKKKNEYTQFQIRRNNLKNELKEQNSRLLDMAIQINHFSTQHSNELLQQASRLFEAGDSQGAAQLLNPIKIGRITDQSLKNFEQAKTLYHSAQERLKSEVEMFLLSAKSILTILNNPNRFNEACAAREKALNIARLCFEQQEYAHYVYKYARFLDKNHKLERALKYYKSALQLYGAILAENKKENNTIISIKAIMARCYNLMGNIHNNCGNFKKAEERYYMSQKLYQHLHKLNIDAEYDGKLLLVQSNLGVLYYRNGDKDKGRELINQAVQTYEQFTPEKQEIFRPDIANCWINIGCFYKNDTQKHREARRNLEKALECYLQLHSLKKIDYRSKIAICYHNIGEIRVENGWMEGDKFLLKALKYRHELAQKKPEVYLPEEACTLRSLGKHYQFKALKIKELDTDNVLSIINFKKTSIDYYLKSVSIYQLLETEEILETQQEYCSYTAIIAEVQNIIGEIYHDIGQSQAAAIQYKNAIQSFQKLSSKNTAYKQYIRILEQKIYSLIGVQVVNEHSLVH